MTSGAHEMRSLHHSSRTNIKVFTGPRNCARKKRFTFSQDIETGSGARAAFSEWVPEIHNSGRAADAKNVWSCTSNHPTCHRGVCSYKPTFKLVTLYSIQCLQFVDKKEDLYCAVRNIYFPKHTHTHIYIYIYNVALIRTNRRRLGTFKNQCFFFSLKVKYPRWAKLPNTLETQPRWYQQTHKHRICSYKLFTFLSNLLIV
jgi:hypothetical protein